MIITTTSRDTLQRKTAVKTFTSIVITGFATLIVTFFLQYKHQQTGLSFRSDSFIIYGLSVIALLALAFLFALRSYRTLAQPVNQLEKITHALPLISSKKYDDARNVFKLVNAVSRHHEIDELQTATLQLANVLEQFDNNVKQKTQQIRNQNKTLLSDRDFIKSLLNTAQLIILTINKDFRITLFNDYAEKITGYSSQDMLNSEVSCLFPAGNWTEAQVCFEELLAARQHVAQQESELIDKSGQIRQISWLHSQLDNHDSQSAILSVGLDMTAKKEAEKRVVWMAEHDPLTDLCNRRKFTEEFEKSLRTAIRYNHSNSLLFLDLDQFKDINDTSGHSAGDEVLKLVSKTLNRVTRFTDLVARLGGDEFAILMSESDVVGAETLASKIITELGLIQLEYGRVRHKVSTSIGVVHFPLRGASIHELMGFADLAMYKAKASGKSTFHTFSPDDQTRDQLEARVFWKHQIEQALESHLFVMHYQPILKLSTQTIQHYELLIRMRDPDSGELRMPGKFIAIAEEVDLIQSIDNYVLQHGMRKLSELQRKGMKVQFSINLSGSIVDAPILLPLMKRYIKKYDIDPQGLIFEVTETAAVSNLQQAKLMMTAIKALGCQFSLDDFGVGFASFRYMRELPVDIIKIDGIFIKDLNKNADDQLFVKALVDVARGLGRRIVAEFVENKEVLTILQSYGVDFAQGYYIGRPQADIQDTIDWQPPSEQ